MKSKFQKTRLVDVGDDPNNWIRQLELIKRQLNILGDKLDEEDLMLHILNNMPSKYGNVVQTSEEDLTDGELTMSKLTKRIRNRYCQLKKENDDDQEEQVALYAKKGGRPKCNHCGKIGHMSKDCWELEKNKDKKAAYLKKHGTNNKDGKNNN